MSGQLEHATRRQVFTALLALLANTVPPTGTKWNTMSQSLLQWDEVPSESQPALFLFRGPQSTEQKHAFGVARWQLRCTIWIYYRVDGLKTENTYPDQLTDEFLDNLEIVMQTDPVVGAQTLGGLVTHCWIDGACVFDSGITDGQAVLVVPISILL